MKYLEYKLDKELEEERKRKEERSRLREERRRLRKEKKLRKSINRSFKRDRRAPHAGVIDAIVSAAERLNVRHKLLVKLSIVNSQFRDAIALGSSIAPMYQRMDTYSILIAPPKPKLRSNTYLFNAILNDDLEEVRDRTQVMGVRYTLYEKLMMCAKIAAEREAPKLAANNTKKYKFKDTTVRINMKKTPKAWPKTKDTMYIFNTILRELISKFLEKKRKIDNNELIKDTGLIVIDHFDLIDIESNESAHYTIDDVRSMTDPEILKTQQQIHLRDTCEYYLSTLLVYSLIAESSSVASVITDTMHRLGFQVKISYLQAIFMKPVINHTLLRIVTNRPLNIDNGVIPASYSAYVNARAFNIPIDYRSLIASYPSERREWDINRNSFNTIMIHEGDVNRNSRTIITHTIDIGEAYFDISSTNNIKDDEILRIVKHAKSDILVALPHLIVANADIFKILSNGPPTMNNAVAAFELDDVASLMYFLRKGKIDPTELSVYVQTRLRPSNSPKCTKVLSRMLSLLFKQSVSDAFHGLLLDRDSYLDKLAVMQDNARYCFALNAVRLMHMSRGRPDPYQGQFFVITPPD